MVYFVDSGSWPRVHAAGVVFYLQAVFLSGLAGPQSLRLLAVMSFKGINTYNAEELQGLYLEFLAYLDEARVKWVRVGYLRRLAGLGSQMVRCQEVPDVEAVVGSEGFPCSRDQQKPRYVVSHPWMSPAHPDPGGEKLQKLVEQLNLLGASDHEAVFVDYMGLPQHDAQDPDLQRLDGESRWPKPGEHPAVRTEAEELLFKRALGSFEKLYSVAGVRVIVLPMSGRLAAGQDYMSRGWCFLEFCLAYSFGNIGNREVDPDVERLCGIASDLKANTVKGFRKAFQRTHFTCSGDEAVVLRLFEQTLRKKAVVRRSLEIV
ncbi:unnamed protein product [Prorocentrum cordatum]|uniref:Uncharacterized protein n=1 Tax=Prorocentrum cordatum TaxID=2364126 RepID=A0ABN9XHM7_9DINO|nr:unnamed protein product [Polarella glacialis]